MQFIEVHGLPIFKVAADNVQFLQIVSTERRTQCEKLKNVDLIFVFALQR